MDGVERAADTSVRIFLRPLGSALPLGFFAFAIGMLLLGTQALGWIPLRETQTVGLLLVAFVFPLEFVATVIAFLARDTLGATVLGIFTTSWLAIGLVALRATPGTRSDALAIYLFGLAVVVLLFAAVSTSGNLLFTVLLSCAATRAVLAGVYEVGGSRSVERVGGGFGVALAALAVYGGLALLLEDLRQTDVLPLFRRGEARASLEGDLAQQLGRLEREPGVRQRL